MREVRFDQAFMYAYSMREKTHANRTMEDNVPEDVKQRRLREIIEVYRECLLPKNHQEEQGKLRLVLVEEESQRSNESRPMLTGRTDGNRRVIFPGESLMKLPEGLALQLAQRRSTTAAAVGRGKIEGDVVLRADLAEQKDVPLSVSDLLFAPNTVKDEDHIPYTQNGLRVYPESVIESGNAVELVDGKTLVGQYVLVRVVRSFTSTLKGYAVAVSSIKEYKEIEPFL